MIAHYVADHGYLPPEEFVIAIMSAEIPGTDAYARSIAYTMSKALAYRHMGEIASKQGDAKRALTLLNRALIEDPSLAAGARALADAIERPTS
jgi:hypothetical protein